MIQRTNLSILENIGRRINLMKEISKCVQINESQQCATRAIAENKLALCIGVMNKLNEDFEPAGNEWAWWQLFFVERERENRSVNNAE